MTVFSMFLLVLVTIVWGSTFFIIKDTVAHVSPCFLVFSRTILAAVPMSLYVLFKYQRAFFSLAVILRGAALGLLLSTTYISQTIGLKFTTSGHSAFITGSAVVFVPILLFIIWRVPVFPMDVLSILMVFAGLFLLTAVSNAQINPGDVITLITVVAYAIHLVSAGRFVKHDGLIAMIAHQFNFAALFSVAAYLVSGGGSVSLNSKSVFVLIYLGILGTLFCYFVTVWAQKYVSAVQVAMIFALEPVFAALFAYLFAGERLQGVEILGMILILAGIVLYQGVKTFREGKSSRGTAVCT
jgi:drug/metabolite transporter (DMT)-like permease